MLRNIQITSILLFAAISFVRFPALADDREPPLSFGETLQASVHALADARDTLRSRIETALVDRSRREARDGLHVHGGGVEVQAAGDDELDRRMQTVIRTLNGQRAAVGRLACEEGTARVALHADGISFGHLVATSNMESPCRNTYDFAELERLDEELADKVFGWSAEKPTLAEFARIWSPREGVPVDIAHAGPLG